MAVDENGRLITPDPTPEELDTLHQQLTMLDVSGNGVGAEALRPFYPGVGWNVLLKRIDTLVTAGRATKRFGGGRVKTVFYSPVAE